MRALAVLLLVFIGAGCPTTIPVREPYYPPESQRQYEAQLNEATRAWERYKEEQYGIHESLPK
jgi:hypothetical protein